MKKSFISFVVLLLLLVSAPAFAELTGNLNFSTGIKYLQSAENKWDQVHVQAELPFPGVEFNFREVSWPVNISLSYHQTNMITWLNLIATTIGVLDMEYGTTQEFNIGIKKIWEESDHFRPYFGLGASYIVGSMEKQFKLLNLIEVDEYDRSKGLGFWVDAGVYWELWDHLNLGFGVAYSMASLKLFGNQVNGGGTRGSVFIGYHF